MRVAIIGSMGVPGKYGGFETLAENLVREHRKSGPAKQLVVYCSAKVYHERPSAFEGAELRYVHLSANGVQSILYDIWSMLDAVIRGVDVIVLLGVSGAMILPILRMTRRVRIITNVDGIEHRREKWGGLAQRFLRWSEAAAVRWSNVVIADNRGIADHIQTAYGRSSTVIAYGGDHAVELSVTSSDAKNAAPVGAMPDSYALALCRIEPENNVHTILEAWSKTALNLVFVGNWNSSDYGRNLKTKFKEHAQIHLLDPIYEPSALYRIRRQARYFVHGHSAGGTNPSLVEAMHFGRPVFAFDCAFNRYTTEDAALYFKDAEDLTELINGDCEVLDRYGPKMLEIARRRYTWAKISREYFELLSDS